MNRTKFSIFLIAATIITVGALFMLPYTPKISVNTAEITYGELVLTTFLDGTVVYCNEQPYAALQSGIIENVNVSKGQRVIAGELLFSIDSTYEQRAIEVISGIIYEQEKALNLLPYSEAAAAACAQSLLGLRTEISQLRASIEAKQIRALSDGVVGGVYVRDGDRVQQGSLLGAVYSEGKQLSAVCLASDAARVRSGTPANLYSAAGKRLGLASLSLTNAPSINESTGQAIQVLCFTPNDNSALDETNIGDSVTVELLMDVLPDKALAPISAVDSNSNIWIVDDGRTVPVKIDAGKRNESMVSVPEQYTECKVVLLPDNYELYSGRPVKEHSKK